MACSCHERIEHLESEVKRLKAKCNRLIRENRELKANTNVTEEDAYNQTLQDYEDWHGSGHGHWDD